MRQPGADDDDRQARLRDLVAGRAQGRHVVGPEVLHLVDEHGDAAGGVGGRAAEVGEQLDQVDLDVAGVGAPGDRRDRDAGVPPVAQLRRAAPRPTGRLALGERLDHTEGVVTGTAGRAELAHRLVHGRRERAAQRLVGPGLELAGAPAGTHRRRAQRVEQHGLADAAQPGEHDRALGAPAGHPLEHDVEGVELLVAPGELGRALPRAGGVGVPDRVHDRRLYASLAFTAYIRIQP